MWGRNQRYHLILASRSKMRLKLLHEFGISPEVRPSNIAEEIQRGESSRALVIRLSDEKAARVAKGSAATDLILAADTVAGIGSRPLAEPTDDSDASREIASKNLRRLSGRVHAVYTGVVLYRGSKRIGRVVVKTKVLLYPIIREQISAYLTTGHWAGTSAGYSLEHLAGMALVRETHGSYTNIVGLPLFETMNLLTRAGLSPPGHPMAHQ